MAAPAADLTGRWNANLQFFSSTSQHTLIFEKQDGNWLQGLHQGEFTTRNLAGTIAGNEVRFRSNWTFSGILEGDTISGEVQMGEYLWATFIATRHDYPDTRVPIVVPRGQPLAT